MSRFSNFLAGARKPVSWKTVIISALVAWPIGLVIAQSAQNHYLGVVFVADPTVTTRQMTVNADGSINTTGSSSSSSSSTGTVAPGTAATNSTLVGCVNNTTIPAPTNGQQVAIQCGPDAGLLLADNYTVTASASSATTILYQDTRGYGSANVQFSTIGGSNQVTFEQSNDNAVCSSVSVWSPSYVGNDSTGAWILNNIIAPTTSGSWTVRLTHRCFRLRVSTYGSGTVTAFVTFKKDAGPQPLISLGANSQIIGSVGIDQTTAVTTNGVVIAPVTASAAGQVPIVTAAAAASKILCAAACNVYGFEVTTGASAGTVYLFNATSLPGDGAVTPTKCYEVAANSSLVRDYRPGPPIRMSTGATVGFGTGTNCFSLANSATAFISGEAQ
jgi:hypothetical protein